LILCEEVSGLDDGTTLRALKNLAKTKGAIGDKDSKKHLQKELIRRARRVRSRKRAER
jgi:hypothetical protein